MTKEKTDDSQHALFMPDTAGQAGEFFRLAIPLLAKHKAPTNPVNFSLFYNYVAGRSPLLKEKLDEFTKEQGAWSQDDADRLFKRFIYGCDASVLEALREELLAIVAQTIGGLVDLAGAASVSNEKFSHHLEQLSASKKPEQVLSAVSAIMSETRSLVADTKQLESKLTVSSSEMAKLKEELESAKQSAATDALTSVLNRRGFDEVLADLVSGCKRRHTADFCLVLLDLDHFKKINDTYGHLVGDKVLTAIGGILKNHTKGQDCSSRYGGEEFAILLPETRIGNAFNLAENLRISIEKTVLKRPSTGEVLADMTASFGVAGYRLGESVEDFLGRCDKAMYRAKELGRNRVVMAD